MTSKLSINSATRLRLVLFIILGLLIAAAVALSAFGIQYLNTQALEVQQVVYDATNGDQKLQRIQQLSTKLQQDQDAVLRAKQVVAESKSYKYQDVIIRDLQTMASRAGVSITNFDFISGAAAGGSAPTAPTTQTPAAPAASGGLRSTTVNITLKTPVNYRNLLTFIHYIEQNLTKMQIARIGLSNAGSEISSSSVTSEALTLEVYIR